MPSLMKVYVEFTRNKAVVASAVYSNNLDLCSWSSLYEPFFDRLLPYRWKFVNYRYNDLLIVFVNDKCYFSQVVTI